MKYVSRAPNEEEERELSELPFGSEPDFWEAWGVPVVCFVSKGCPGSFGATSHRIPHWAETLVFEWFKVARDRGDVITYGPPRSRDPEDRWLKGHLPSGDVIFIGLDAGPSIALEDAVSKAVRGSYESAVLETYSMACCCAYRLGSIESAMAVFPEP
jgi:hypothetical protein